MKVLPETFRKCLSHDARKSISQPTKEESMAIGEAKSERELQRLIYLELLRRGLFFHYSRSDRKTTTKLGTPDFGLCLNGNYIAVECKTSSGKQSTEQIAVQRQIERQGGIYMIVRSLDEFLQVLKVNGL
jgi:hypothetical protein